VAPPESVPVPIQLPVRLSGCDGCDGIPGDPPQEIAAAARAAADTLRKTAFT
jgi:hypothetical protein